MRMGLSFSTIQNSFHKDGTEVMVTYLEEERVEEVSHQDPLLALRGRGKGERLVERLLRARQEDAQHDESTLR